MTRCIRAVPAATALAFTTACSTAAQRAAASMRLENIGEFVRVPAKADATPATRDDSFGDYAVSGASDKRSRLKQPAPRSTLALTVVS